MCVCMCVCGEGGVGRGERDGRGGRRGVRRGGGVRLFDQNIYCWIVQNTFFYCLCCFFFFLFFTVFARSCDELLLCRGSSCQRACMVSKACCFVLMVLSLEHHLSRKAPQPHSRSCRSQVHMCKQHYERSSHTFTTATEFPHIPTDTYDLSALLGLYIYIYIYIVFVLFFLVAFTFVLVKRKKGSFFLCVFQFFSFLLFWFSVLFSVFLWFCFYLLVRQYSFVFVFFKM